MVSKREASQDSKGLLRCRQKQSDVGVSECDAERREEEAAREAVRKERRKKANQAGSEGE